MWKKKIAELKTWEKRDECILYNHDIINQKIYKLAAEVIDQE